MCELEGEEKPEDNDVEMRNIDEEENPEEEEKQEEKESEREKNKTSVAAKPSKKYLKLPREELTKQMKEFLDSMEKHYKRSSCLTRDSQTLSASTLSKIQERVLVYLGYLSDCGKIELLSNPFKAFNSQEVYQEYFYDLELKRNVGAATRANYVTALNYATKFCHADKSPKYDSVPLVQKLRQLATNLGREGQQQRWDAKEDKEDEGKWLDWEGVLEVATRQRQRYEMAHSNPLKKAIEGMDHALVSIYTFLPPARCLEIRTMELVHETSKNPFQVLKKQKKNLMVVSSSGKITLVFHIYKTAKFRGKDITEIKEDTQLARVLLNYISKDRPVLLQGKNSPYVFVNRHSEPFTSAAFSAHTQSIFKRNCGIKLCVNQLRSSFVTWAYSRKDVTEEQKTSVADALRHSPAQSRLTYDRRSSVKRKEAAIAMATEVARNSGPPAIAPGSFAALVTKESTLRKPDVILARVYAYQGNEAILLRYRCVKGNQYQLVLDGNIWREPVDALTPVKVCESKVREGVYVGSHILLSDKRSLHKAAKEA